MAGNLYSLQYLRGHNAELLSTRPWMDLAMIYATGRRAILNLERDEASIRVASHLIAGVTTGNSTVVTKRVAIESPQAIERVIAIEETGSLKEPLLKNGFDTQSYEMISAVLNKVLSSTKFTQRRPPPNPDGAGSQLADADSPPT